MTPEHYKKLLTCLYGNEDPTACLWEDSYIKILDDAIETLAPRYARILRRRMEGQTLRRIGTDEGVTPERIRQMEAKALRELRHPKRLSLNTYIKEKYLCEFEETGETETGTFEHNGAPHPYSYKRKRCRFCKQYSGERNAPDLRCVAKRQINNK